MSEELMPAIEAETVDSDAGERQSYELAFHVLPTIAEGEVSTVFEAVKSAVKTAGGEVFDEEVPERFELAYEVVRHLEGKNRKFKSAYFGWVRFKAEPEVIAEITAAMDGNNSILRHLLLRLTRVEEENPFRFHEALRDQKMVTNVEESEVVPDLSATDEENTEETEEENGEVDQEALDKALEKEDL